MKTKRDIYCLSDEDLKLWDIRNDFTVSEAACLSVDVNPALVGRTELPAEINGRIDTMTEVLEGAIRSGEIKVIKPKKVDVPINQKSSSISDEFDKAYNRLMALSSKSLATNTKKAMPDYVGNLRNKPIGPRLARIDLTAFLSIKGLRPKSLFPEERFSEHGCKGIEEITTPPAFVYSPDYRTVNSNGEVYTFTTNQAAVIESLHMASVKGTPELSQEHLLDVVLKVSSSRLRDTFKKHPAWNRLIIAGQKKGTYKLNI